MKIAAYMYLIRGNEYKFPYRECVRSILPFCESVHVLTDPRFSDTQAIIDELEIISSKIIIHCEKLDLDNPGVDGLSKARARFLASQDNCDWLIQMDADEVFRAEDVKKVDKLLQMDVDIISCGVINWFNGNHIKVTSTWSKERFSRNVKYITHGIPVQFREERDDGKYYVDPDAPTDGAGYIDLGGNSLAGITTTYTDIQKLVAKQKDNRYYVSSQFYDSLHNDIWVHHYSWYSIPYRWLREMTWDYFWGVLRGKYLDLQTFENMDGKKRKFFMQTKLRCCRDYQVPLVSEMQKHAKELFYFNLVKHPVIMNNWLQMVKPYTYGRQANQLVKPAFSLYSLFNRREKQPLFT